jgi:hypothetical protein
MLRRLGRERYVAELAEHRRLLREAFARHGGVEVEMQGDGFHYAFSYARDAVAAAADAQRALAEHRWIDEPIRVRMGLHTGEPSVQDNLYAGLDVHRAARVMSAASGGQVLLSARTTDLVDGELPDELGLKTLGLFQLKGFDRAEPLTQLVVVGLEADFGPPKAEAASYSPSRRGRLPAKVYIALAVIVAASAATAPLVLLRSDGPAALARIAPNSLGAIDPESNRLIAQVAVGAAPTRLAVGFGSVWIVNSEEPSVSRVDEQSRTVKTIALPGQPTGVAVGDDVVWVIHYATAAPGYARTAKTAVSRIGPRLNTVLQTIPVPQPSDLNFRRNPIAVSSRWVWAGLATQNGVLVQIDPTTQSIRARIAAAPDDIAADGESVWLVSPVGLQRLDARTKEVVATFPLALPERLDLRPAPTAVALGNGSVWVASRVARSCRFPNPCEDAQGIVSRIDPAVGAVTATIRVPPNPHGIAVGAGAVWVASRTGSVIRSDPATHRIVARIPIGSPAEGIAVGDSAVWVAVG